jgi:uncharacterized membrane protein
MSRILLAGEQVTIYTVEIKGFDHFVTSQSKEDGARFCRALKEGGHAVDWIKSCDVPIDFPESAESLGRYDVVILSDIGTNSLLLHPDVVSSSLRRPNRLKLLRQFVEDGGGLAMIGGWMSFSGIDGKARYHGTCLEDVLPVVCGDFDDRVEVPEGVVPAVRDPLHPILRGVGADWPYFLGYNRVTAKHGSITLMSAGTDPLLCVGRYGKGRSVAFMSDCAPHWGTKEFLDWSGYDLFWNNLVSWLSDREA